MADFVPVPVNAGNAAGFSFAADIRIADPFTSTNLTWTEVVNPTSEDWGGFHVNLINDDRGIFFVGIGDAPETIIAVLPVSYGVRQCLSLPVPIPIPAGTRIAVASSCSTTTQIEGQIIGVPAAKFDALPPFTIMESGPYRLDGGSADYGKHVLVDPGAIANTKSAFVEISQTLGNSANNVLNGNSLANAYDIIGFILGDNYNSGQGLQNRYWDLATGNSPEVIFDADHWQGTSPSEFNSQNSVVWDHEGAAAGTRYAARMRSNSVDAIDRIGTVLLFGLR